MYDNLEIAGRLQSAVFAGDEAEIEALIHPDFELLQAKRIPYAENYRGFAGFMRFLGNFQAYYAIEKLEPVASYVADDGNIVAEFRLLATARKSGERIDTSILEKWEFADGRIIRVTPHYFD